jgi:hypothetical protein
VISLGHVSSKDLRDRYLAAGDRQNARVALILRLRELLEVADFNAEDMKVAAAMVVAAQERVPERASEPGCVAMPARVPRSLVDGNCKAHGYWNSASGEGCPTCVVVSKKGGASMGIGLTQFACHDANLSRLGFTPGQEPSHQ